MRKIIFLASFIFSLFIFLKPALARDCVIDYTPKDIFDNSTVTFSIQNTEKDHKYMLMITNPSGQSNIYTSEYTKAEEENQILSWEVKLSDNGIGPGEYKFKVNDSKIGALTCPGINIEVKPTNKNCPNYTGYDGGTSESDPVTLKFETGPQFGTLIRVDGDNNKIFRLHSPSNTIDVGTYSVGSHYFEAWPLVGETTSLCYKKYFTVTKGTCTVSITPQEFQPGTSGTLQANGPGIEQGKKYILDFQGCEGRCANSNQPQSLNYQFQINDLKCKEGYHLLVVKRIIGGFDCPSPNTGEALCSTSFWTKGTAGGEYQGAQPKYCDPPMNTKIDTGLGCIPIKDANQFITWFLRFAIGIGGGIAFLLMIFGAFQIITSTGDPERLKAGKELITSALIGLLMIIFSLFLLQLIGVQILQIPGWK